MKMTKILAASALSLSLVGTGLIPAKAEEQVNSEIQSQEENIYVQNHKTINGDDPIIDLRSSTAIDLKNQALGNGTYMATFHIGTKNRDVKYYVKNTGNNAFTWKIRDPYGQTWSSGALNPGNQSISIADGQFDYIPVGEYTFLVTSNDGGPGNFDFSVRILD
ncbi:hypothetical protein CSE16_01645 [Solibacillus sp. R5-41]|uniref:hypothetical protein n=1 Tax=Solibacillus sp. R5-41 TaxID=2048654 RepID=UPI000C125D51|nr:hypothetical protein [Solibacillus sp. R5-41]ATP38820.1 hypothetical protein CSE16_01645 [Solibacillus sp. R5-41]